MSLAPWGDGRASPLATALPSPARHRSGANQSAATLVGVVTVSAYLILVIWATMFTPYDTWAAFVLAPLLFMATAPFLRRMLNKVEPDPSIRTLVMAGLGAKLIGAFARFYTNEFVLGRGDSIVYHNHGSRVAAEFRSFVFGGPAFEAALPDFTGTRFIRLLTALFYVPMGSTRLGGFVMFSFMSFWGLYLFYRAYTIAMPDGLRKRYAIFVFFLPSMVFWPSSIGKEAFMTLMLGLGTYGIARVTTQQRFGYTAIAAAMTGMAVVRPHMAAIFGAGLGAAFVLRRSSGSGGTTRKIVGLLVLAVMAGLVLRQLQAFFGLEEGLDAQAVFDKASDRSNQGGSKFAASQPTSLAGLPWAIVTVLFRPFFYEADSLAGLVTALEGTILLGLFLWNLPRLARLPGLMVSRPFIGFMVVYVLVFTFAFSSISNFGILARQRTQLFPIAVVALTVPFTSALRTRQNLARPSGSRGAGEPGLKVSLPTPERDDRQPGWGATEARR